MTTINSDVHQCPKDNPTPGNHRTQSGHFRHFIPRVVLCIDSPEIVSVINEMCPDFKT